MDPQYTNQQQPLMGQPGYQMQPGYQQPPPGYQQPPPGYQQPPQNYQQPPPNYQQPPPNYQQPQTNINQPDLNGTAAGELYPSQAPENLKAQAQVEVGKGYLEQQKLGYCRKVFGIVTLQMIVTFAIALSASAFEAFGLFCIQWYIQLTSLIMMIVFMIVLLCVQRMRKRVPINYILLLGFTVCWGFVIAGITRWLTFDSVLLSIFVLIAAVGSLCVAAMCTPITPKLIMFLMIGLMVGCTIQLVCVLTLCFTGYWSNYYYCLYGTMGCLICGIAIFFDVVKIQMLGKVAVDEYILGALLLYIDIVRLLLFLLMLLGKGKKK